MSLSRPSYVSPTTGSDQATRGPACSTETATSASRTTPTLCVLVIAIGPGELPGFADPFEAGQLAVAVEAVAAGEDRRVRVRRHDHRDPGSDRSLADDERPVAFDDRGVSHADARDIRDGVERPRAAQPDGDAEVSRPHRWMLAVARASATLVSHGAQGRGLRAANCAPGNGSAP